MVQRSLLSLVTLTSAGVSQVPLQTPARDDPSLRWCTCELFFTSLSWCGPAWEPSGCPMTAKAAILPRWGPSSPQWLRGKLTGAILVQIRHFIVLGRPLSRHLSPFSWHDSWIILLFTGIGVLFVFDPLGDPRPPNTTMEPLGVRNLQSNEGNQFFSTARSLAVKVWENRLRLLCCCLPQDESNRGAFSSIAQLVSGFFSVRSDALSSGRVSPFYLCGRKWVSD